MADTRSMAGVTALVLAVLALAGCGQSGPAHGPPSPNAPAGVTTGFESYSPATVTVHAGDMVEWRNTSLITHTVTDDPKLAAKDGDSSLPPGVPPFDSGDMPAGQIYSHTFAAPGTYRYFCTHHEGRGHARHRDRDAGFVACDQGGGRTARSVAQVPKAGSRS